MGRWALLLALATGALAACTPEIGSGAYYCGPERLCPPDFACDDNSYTCIYPFQVEPFACPDGSEADEPNDSLAQADDLGPLTCGSSILDATGCVLGDDADYYRMDSASSCSGNDPHLQIKLRFPVADVPLELELLDDSGAVVTTGEDCTPQDNFSGRTHLCIRFVPDTGVYFVRVQRQADGPDCDGACNFNQYQLDIVYPLS